MANALLRNPTNIGDIFFSGSQPVKKGEQVTWILDETWAFKATETCGVSTNASPFVQLKIGQTFLIYKRTQKDIDDNNDPTTPTNSKGIYIFDRDTIVALAYPQEVTQDIIIENDIYNNNMSTFILESSKAPIAKITLSNSSPRVGTPVTVSGTSSYSNATDITGLSYAWKLNGAVPPGGGTGSSFKYTPSKARVDDVLLVVTNVGGNSAGLKNSTSTGIRVSAKPVYDDIKMTYDFQTGSNGSSSPIHFAHAKATESGTGSVEVKTSIAVSPSIDGRTFYVDIFRSGTKIKRQELYVKGNKVDTITAIATYSGTVNINDVFTAVVGRTDQRRTFKAGIYLDNTPQMQIKITNRTS